MRTFVFLALTVLLCSCGDNRETDPTTLQEEESGTPKIDTVAISRAIADAMTQASLNTGQASAPPRMAYAAQADVGPVTFPIDAEIMCELGGAMKIDGDSSGTSQREGTSTTIDLSVAARYFFLSCQMPDAVSMPVTIDSAPSLAATGKLRWNWFSASSPTTEPAATPSLSFDLSISGQILASGTGYTEFPCDIDLSFTVSGGGTVGEPVYRRSITGAVCGTQVTEESD